MLIASLLAAAPVDVNVARSGLDIAQATFTMVAALTTVAAVAVALFGEDLRARRRRPKLTLRAEPEIEAIVSRGEERSGGGTVYLQLYAQPGRDKAQDVELFVSLGTTMEMVHDSPVIGILRDVNINFDGGRIGAGEGSTVSSVPPGMIRHIPLVMLGDGRALFDSALTHVPGDWLPEHFDQDFCAFLHTFPARQDRVDWIVADAPYSVFIVIAGSNFDAISYAGAFSVERVDMAGADELELANLVSVKLAWTTPLAPSDGPPDWVLTDKM